MYCVHCGEHWTDCICVPWCWKHDRLAPCAACEREEQERLAKIELLKPYKVPWYVGLVKMFLG